MPEKEIEKRVRAALDQVGLLGRERTRPIELSTGEQQRVGIARAIIGKPALLIADEPTGNLDPDLALEIMKLFKRFNEVGVTVLIASHDLHLIERFGVRRVILAQGRHGRLVATPIPTRPCRRNPGGPTMNQWFERHVQTLVGSLGRLWQQPFATLLTILVIGIALALPACLHVLVQNVRVASGGWNSALDFSVYMKPNASLDQAKRAAERIRQAPRRRRGHADRGRRRARGIPSQLGLRRRARRAEGQSAAARARGAAGRRVPRGRPRAGALGRAARRSTASTSCSSTPSGSAASTRCST